MRILSLTCIAALAFGAACSDDDDDFVDSTLEVQNASDFTIEELYLTDVNSSDFGPNLLRGDVLFPDESFVLGVECGVYDALLIDESGTECELQSIDLCFDDATWVIQNNTCDVFAAARAAREKAATDKATGTETAK
ncbi:MAG: hypothetical protein H0T79_17650 [Deltaproteobacteria bacterium]|nr:hypothetical protein [Deltaproteobacteria bacterium]